MEIKDGKFVLINHGRRPIYVDGQPLLTDKSVILYHNQLLEVSNKLLYPLTYYTFQVCSLSFLVLLNYSLVASLCDRNNVN